MWALLFVVCPSFQILLIMTSTKITSFSELSFFYSSRQVFRHLSAQHSSVHSSSYILVHQLDTLLISGSAGSSTYVHTYYIDEEAILTLFGCR